MCVRQWPAKIRSKEAVQNAACLRIFYAEIRSLYSPQKQMSLDETMIPWRGHMKFRIHNLEKITLQSVGENGL
jgi:hypothetical protein